MVFILDNKKYDTEKSDLILKYKKKFEGLVLFNVQTYDWNSMTLYKTQKGNWFVVRETKNKFIAYKEDDKSVTEILNELNEYELIEKHFGNMDEA